MAEALPREGMERWWTREENTADSNRFRVEDCYLTMNGKETTRFFDTSGCLNLSRPTKNTNPSTIVTKRARTASIPIRGQRKIDLYNFDHIDFVDSKYVLTSPRSLEACARLNVKVKQTEDDLFSSMNSSLSI